MRQSSWTLLVTSEWPGKSSIRALVNVSSLWWRHNNISPFLFQISIETENSNSGVSLGFLARQISAACGMSPVLYVCPHTDVVWDKSVPPHVTGLSHWNQVFQYQCMLIADPVKTEMYDCITNFGNEWNISSNSGALFYRVEYLLYRYIATLSSPISSIIFLSRFDILIEYIVCSLLASW